MGLPAEGVDSLEMIDNMKREAEEMKAFFTGKLPLPIPMVPEVLHYNEFVKIPSVQEALAEKNLFPIGLDFEEAESISWDTLNGNILFTTNQISENSPKLDYMLKIAKNKDYKFVLLDSGSNELYEHYDDSAAYATEKEAYAELIEKLYNSMKDRGEEYQKYRQENDNALPSEIFFKEDRVIIFINNITQIAGLLTTAASNHLIEMMETEGKMGMTFISATDIFTLTKAYDDVSKLLKRATQIVMNTRLNDQSVYSPANKKYKEPMLNEGEAYYIQNNFALLIKLVDIHGEEE